MCLAPALRLARTVLCLAALVLAPPAVLCAAGETLARGGALDLSAWDFGRDGIATLDGEWTFVARRWLPPEDPGAPAGQALPVPGEWNAAAGDGKSYGSYRLDVACRQAGGLALALPMQHSALALYVNGTRVGSQGEPATDAASYRPAFGHQTLSLGALACPLRIVAHVANFDLPRGGLVRSIQLGTQAQLLQRREQALARNLLALGGVLSLGLVSLTFYFWRRRDRTPLFFGLFCLSFGVSLGLSGERALQVYLAGLGFEGHWKLLFVNWFAGLAVFPLLLRSLYPREMPAWAVRAITGFSLGGVALTVLTPVRIFAVSAVALQVAAAVVATFMVVTLVQARRHGQRGAAILLAGLAVLVAAVAHDVVFFRHLMAISLLPYGMFGFVLAPAVLLAQRFAQALSAEELRAIEQGGRVDLLVRATKAGVLDWDAVTDTVTLSERYREMLGYAGTGEPPPFRELVHPDDRDMVQASFLRQLRDRSTTGVRVNEPMDYRMRHAEGHEVWVHAEAISLCGADGRTLRYICSFIDISERKRHEQETSDRLKFINDLFDSVPIGLALRDPEGRILFVNRAWERYVGMRREKVVGTLLANLPHPDAAQAHLLDRRALALGAGASTPTHEYGSEGRRYLQTRAVVADRDGRAIGVLAASLDITEKHAVEQALATERERLRLLVRATRAGFGDWDAVADRVTYTDRFKEMLGYPPGTDTSDWPSIFEMIHPHDREAARAQFRAMIRRKAQGGEQEPGEPMSYRLRRADGNYIWIHAEGISQVDGEGRTRRFITSYLDVSALREQQEALRVQVELTRTEQRRLDLVVRATEAGIVDWDGHTHVTYYSPRFREIRGYAPDADTEGWPDYFRVMIHPDDRARVIGRWVPFIKGKGPEGPRGDFYSPEEYRLLRADGSYVWVQVSGMAVRDERDFVVRWIAAIIDITGRHLQQEALRASRDQIAAQAELLEQQNETLKENVRLREEVERIGRHDLKTPLNSIVAVPRLLREERRLGPEADELLGIVERAGYRILSMVNLSLDLYKMEQGSYVFRPDAVDLADLVNKVAVDVRMHAASKQVRLALDVHRAPYAWAEELLCYSLVANLLKNAVEASPEGAVVTVSAHAGPDTVLLRIHNRGVVPPAVQGSFFQKYATMGKASGTGLGTYSARLMARVQDGDVAMETSESAGTTLTVALRAAPEGKVPATVRHAEELRNTEPAPLAELPAMRVLLVDDDEYNLLIVRRFLPSPPFTVETAINGKVALAAAELQWPDVIFMDLDMPVMGGLQAVQQLRALQRATRAAPCTMVALSSHEDEATRQRSLAAGFDSYLTKPVTRETIQRTVLDLLDVRDMASGHPQPVQAPRAAAMQGMADPVVVDPDVEAVLAEFIASRQQLLGDMAQALQAGECGEVQRIAHQLAGGFGLYGFAWASEQSRWIEQNCANASQEQLQELVRQLRDHLVTVPITFG